MVRRLGIKGTFGAAFVLCQCSIGLAADSVTLTDTQGRSITGAVECLSENAVRFNMEGRPPLDIPLAKLSENSRKLLDGMRTTGGIPVAAWPKGKQLPSPYKLKSTGAEWTGSHITIKFLEEPKSRSTSAPEVAFLRTIDTVIAAAKAMPLGILEPDTVFKGEVLDSASYQTAVKKIKDREKTKRRAAAPVPRQPGSAPVRLTTITRVREFIPNYAPFSNYYPHCTYDEEAKVLYVRADAPADFLQPDPKEGIWIPFSERQRIVRLAALQMAMGDHLNSLPDCLVPGLLAYFDTIDQVAGPDLDYSKVHGGLKKLIRSGIQRIEGSKRVMKPFDIEKAARLLTGRANAAPTDVNGALVAYYLLHLDHGGDAAGLAAWFHTSAKEQSAIKAKIDEYNSALIDFQFKVEEFNDEVKVFNQKVEAYNLAIRSKVTLPPASPGQPPVPPIRPDILRDFPKKGGVTALESASRKKCLSALLRGRSTEEVAADFASQMQMILK